MPGQVLHLGASVLCVHGGSAVPTAPQPRVRLGGSPAATVSVPYAVAGCPNTPPCVTATWATGSVRVRSAGVPLPLSTGTAVCMPNGTPLHVSASQTAVRAL